MVVPEGKGGWLASANMCVPILEGTLQTDNSPAIKKKGVGGFKGLSNIKKTQPVYFNEEGFYKKATTVAITFSLMMIS